MYSRITVRPFGLAVICFGLIAPVSSPRALTITPEFTADISQQARDVFNQAISFFNTTYNGTNLNLTMTFGQQAAGGATSGTFVSAYAWTDVRQAIIRNQSGSATDASAVANLPAALATPMVNVPSPLAAALGLRALNGGVFNRAGCSATSVNGCNTFSAALLSGGPDGSPGAALLAVAQHEINEVLGSSSGVGDPLATTSDAFRYGANGMLTSATNPGSGGQSCAKGTPIASLSVDGGKTALVNYNNCANGGDTGDFVVNNPALPQDWAASANTVVGSLTASSPEVTLLDAIGYNLTAPTLVGTTTNTTTTGPVTASSGASVPFEEDDYNLANGGLTPDQFLQVQHDDVSRFADALDKVPVPEPGTMALVLVPAMLTFVTRRRALSR